MLLTVAEIQGALETDLPSATLRMFLDAAEADITRLVGDPAVQTDRVHGRWAVLFLSRRAASITSVSEISGSTATVLDEDDYAIRLDGLALKRVDGCAFASVVEVVYVPFDDLALRRRVQLDLVKLAVSYRGAVKSESSGDYTATASLAMEGYEVERRALLSALVPSMGVTC